MRTPLNRSLGDRTLGHRSLGLIGAAAIALTLSACVPFPSAPAPASPSGSSEGAPAAEAPSVAPIPSNTVPVAPAETAAPADVKPGSMAPEGEAAHDPETSDPTMQAVMDAVRARYEYVRDGDYAAACSLYSEHFAQNLAELAETDGSSCVASHAAGVENAFTYLAEAKQQKRLALTPFFYIPSQILVDPELIEIEDNGTTAFLNPLAVRSLDPTEFADGVGEVPGWIEIQDYLKLVDGKWLFIDMTEQ